MPAPSPSVQAALEAQWRAAQAKAQQAAEALVEAQARLTALNQRLANLALPRPGCAGAIARQQAHAQHLRDQRPQAEAAVQHAHAAAQAAADQAEDHRRKVLGVQVLTDRAEREAAVARRRAEERAVDERNARRRPSGGLTQ